MGIIVQMEHMSSLIIAQDLMPILTIIIAILLLHTAMDMVTMIPIIAVVLTVPIGTLLLIMILIMTMDTVAITTAIKISP